MILDKARSLVANWGQLSATTFSGLDLGESTYSTKSKRGVVLTVQDQQWLLYVTVLPGRRPIDSADEMLAENALRRLISRNLSRHKKVVPSSFGYEVAGEAKSSLVTLGGVHYAPAAAILTAAGLKVTKSRQLPVVRGWRGNELVATVAAGSRELKVNGKIVRPSLPYACWVDGNELYAPVTRLATSIGLCTYLTGPMPALHVARVNVPRPRIALHLELPAGITLPRPKVAHPTGRD